MKLLQFGHFYMDPDKITYVRRVLPEVKALPPHNQARIQIGLAYGEVTLYDDDPGYAEFLDWLDRTAQPYSSASP